MVHFRLYIPHFIFFFVAFVAASAWTFVVAANMDADDVTDPDEKKWQMYNYIAASIFAVFALISMFWGIIHTNKLRREGYIDGLSPAEQAVWLKNKLSNKSINELRTRLGVQQPIQSNQQVQMTNMNNTSQNNTNQNNANQNNNNQGSN